MTRASPLLSTQKSAQTYISSKAWLFEEIGLFKSATDFADPVRFKSDAGAPPAACNALSLLLLLMRAMAAPAPPPPLPILKTYSDTLLCSSPGKSTVADVSPNQFSELWRRKSLSLPWQGSLSAPTVYAKSTGSLWKSCNPLAARSFRRIFPEDTLDVVVVHSRQ